MTLSPHVALGAGRDEVEVEYGCCKRDAGQEAGCVIRCHSLGADESRASPDRSGLDAATGATGGDQATTDRRGRVCGVTLAGRRRRVGRLRRKWTQVPRWRLEPERWFAADAA